MPLKLSTQCIASEDAVPILSLLPLRNLGYLLQGGQHGILVMQARLHLHCLAYSLRDDKVATHPCGHLPTHPPWSSKDSMENTIHGSCEHLQVFWCLSVLLKCCMYASGAKHSSKAYTARQFCCCAMVIRQKLWTCSAAIC